MPHPLIFWEGEHSLFPEPGGDGHERDVPALHRRAWSRHTRELALLLAPNVNSYKRFARGSFAPTALVWGHDNRTCALRVVGHGTGMRVESRVAGGDVNPYLAFAAMLAAGLAGIDGGSSSARPSRAPATSAERRTCRRPCTRRARSSPPRRSRARRFGDEVVDHYLNAARRRARRVRGRRHRLGAAPLLRAPVSRPRIGITRLSHERPLDALGPRGDGDPAGLRRGRAPGRRRADPAAADARRRRRARRGARRPRRPGADRRPRPRPGALRRGARGGHRRADARAPGARRVRAGAAARGAAPRAAGARHLPRPPAHERRARRHARAGHRPRTSSTSRRTARSSAPTAATA